MNDLKENLNENAHIGNGSEWFRGVRISDSGAVTAARTRTCTDLPPLHSCGRVTGNRSVLLPHYSSWRPIAVCVARVWLCASDLVVFRARGPGRVQFYSIHFTIFIHFSEFLGFLGFGFRVL